MIFCIPGHLDLSQNDKLVDALSSVSFSLSYSKTDAGKERDVIQSSCRITVSLYVLLNCKREAFS